MANDRICTIPECSKPSHGAKPYCRNHDHRLRKYGDPTAGGTSNGEPLQWLYRHKDHADKSACLIWPYKRHGPKSGGRGYGRLIDPDTGKYIFAHRKMCEIAHGPAPEAGSETAHSCGEGHNGCINPHHLRWDTTQGNADDRRVHRTENKGSRNGQAVLTEDEVREIKSLLGTVSQRALAKRFSVSRWAVSDIARNRRWAWLTV